MLAPRGVVPPWAEQASWRHLFARLRTVTDWRLIASAAALFAGVVAVSGLLFLVIPRFQIENSLFLERFVVKKAMTGFNDSIKFGDITDITQDDSIAFEVDLSDPAQAPVNPYWRMVVLDDYNDGRFKLSSNLRGAFNTERTAANIYSQHGAAARAKLDVLPGVGRQPVPPAPRQFLGSPVHRDPALPLLLRPGDRRAARRAGDDDRLQGGGDGARRHGAARHGVRRPVGPARLGGIPAGRPASAFGRRPGRRSFASVTKSARVKDRSAAGFADQAIAWLHHNHGYSLSPRIPSGPGDPLVRWMTSKESGHCELFAGALVLMARSEGIPAHVVTGFKGGTWNAYSGNYTVRNSDAHAWTELWDERKRAWVREDPLAVAGTLGQADEKGDAALASLMDRSWSARLSSLRVFWYRRIVNFDQQAQADTLKAVKSTADSSGKWLRERRGRGRAPAQALVGRTVGPAPRRARLLCDFGVRRGRMAFHAPSLALRLHWPQGI